MNVIDRFKSLFKGSQTKERHTDIPADITRLETAVLWTREPVNGGAFFNGIYRAKKRTSILRRCRLLTPQLRILRSW